jgi:DNA-binding NarL/FixJ family response regulator
MTRVLLADDHQLLRQALRRALEDAGYDVVAEAGDGEEALHRVAEERPDLVVIDVTMPVLDGVEATRRIHAQWPEVAIVVLTMHAEDALKAEALRAGASAFLTKDSAMHELVATVGAVTRGETMSAEVAARIVREFEPLATVGAASPHHNGQHGQQSQPSRNGNGHEPSPLTPREEEILQLIADGRSTTEAARELFISAKTVKNHLASIYAKLDARDRTQAVLSAVRSGIVRLN